MNRICRFILLSVLVPIFFFSCEKKGNETSLVIYTHDSFISEWGPGPQVIPMFEEKYGIEVNMISAGDTGQMLSRAIMEADKPEADLIIGIDNNMLSKAVGSGILSPYKSKNLDNIQEELLFDKDFYLTPYDYGYFSIIFDSEKIKKPPLSLEDLTRPEYSNKLILMDPRTSSPGLGFLLWTISEYGENFTEYWDRLKPSILTIAEGWDSGYGLFTTGEAPMVLSYTTSPAYHVEYDKTNRYQAVVFPKGNYMQIEGMGIIKGAAHRKAAEKFIDFMLTEDFQRVIPLTNWMFPVSKSTELPESFEYALKPGISLQLDADEILGNHEKWLREWVRTVTK